MVAPLSMCRRSAAGFVYALSVADSMIQTGAANRALVIGAEVFSRILDFNDRTTCVLFGDGAGAVVLGPRHTRHLVKRRTPTASMWIFCVCYRQCVWRQRCLATRSSKMDGQAVFKLAVGVFWRGGPCCPGQGRADRSRYRLADPAPGQHPHHAGHCPQTEDVHGQGGGHRGPARQPSAASIPLALDHAVRAGQVKKGETLLLEGVGGGFTWGAVLLKL